MYKTAVIISTGGGCRAETTSVTYVKHWLMLVWNKCQSYPSMRAIWNVNRASNWQRLLTSHDSSRSIRDAIMQCVLATRPYKKNPGSTDALCDYWLKKIRENITSASLRQYNKYIKEIIHDFDNLQSTRMYRNLVLVVEITLNSTQVLTTILLMNSLKRKAAKSLHLACQISSWYCAMDSTYRANTLMAHGHQALVHWPVAWTIPFAIR